MEALLILAQAQTGASPILQFLPIILIFAIFYFLIIVPQRRTQKKHAAMVAALQRGDRVVTSGGLIGDVVAVREDEVQVKTGTSVVLVERFSIRRRIGADADAGAK